MNSRKIANGVTISEQIRFRILKEISDPLFPRTLLGVQKLKVWGKHPQYGLWILVAGKLVEGMIERNVCTKLYANRLSILRITIYVTLWRKKTLKTWFREQAQCSSHSPGSNHNGHVGQSNTPSVGRTLINGPHLFSLLSKIMLSAQILGIYK